MFKRSIIVSVQGYKQTTTQEMVDDAVSAGATGLRIDKPVKTTVQKIGLHKIKVSNRDIEAFITPTVDLVKKVSAWADYIAVDYRMCNENILEISNYAKENRLQVIADICDYSDYKNIKKNNLYYTYIATTLSVLKNALYPDKRLVKKLINAGEKNIIAEGNYSYRKDVKDVFKYGASAVCIGGAISNVYKLTRKYTSI